MLVKPFKPKDVIAIFALGIIGMLLLNGVNAGLGAILALIIGYYFAHRQDGSDNGV